MGAVRPSPRNPATAMTPSSAADPLPDPWQAARDGACHAPLAGLAFIDVEGADAATFLNGQLSNDVTSLQPGAAQWTSYNSPKGRMLANPLLWRPAAGPAYRLALPADVAAAVRKRLQMFVLCSKVVLKDPDALTAIGVGGPGAAAAVAGVLGRPPPVRRVTDPTAGGAGAVGLAHGRGLGGVPAPEWVSRLGDVCEQGPDLLDFITGIDRGDEIEILARVVDSETGTGAFVSTRVPVREARLASVAGLFPAANWHERETAEMFGIAFVGHPDPRPLLLRSTVGRPPLRRSTVLAARAVTPWPGAADPAAGPRASRRRQQPPGVPDSWLQEDPT